MNALLRVALTIAIAGLLAVASARAEENEENPGLEDLDQATEMTLVATTMGDLAKTIELVQSALAKGLDKENETFAQQLLAGTLTKRATILSELIFREGGPDPRWPQLRQAALADLRRVLRLENKNPQANLLLGRLLALPGGDRREAIRALTTIIEGADDETEPAVLAQAFATRAGIEPDLDKKLADYDEAIKADPRHVEAIRGRSVLHLSKGRLDEAIADLQLAIDLEADSVGNHELLGIALRMNDKSDEALASFGKAIELDPKAPTPYAQRGLTYAGQKKWQNALEDLNKAIELDEKSPLFRVWRAEVHRNAGSQDKALEDLDQAIQLRPDSALAHRVRAELLASAEKIDEAIAGLERWRQAQPTSTQPLIELSRFYMHAKRPRRAIEQLDIVLEADADNSKALRLRGDARLSIARQAEAIADYQAALQLDRDDSGLLNNLAWVLATSPDAKLRDGRRAIKLATKACEATEYKAGHILSTLAAAHAETGDFENAIKWSTKAVEVGDDEQKEQLAKELESYKAGKPWRELQQIEEESAEQEEDKSDRSATANNDADPTTFK